jgi:hypothetical protein
MFDEAPEETVGHDDLWDSDESMGPPVSKKGQDNPKEELKVPQEDEEVLSSDQDQSSNWDSDDSEMIMNGQKYGSTKTSKKGQYEFTFMKDAAFLAMTEEQKEKFLEV